tara:strand:+ start:16103 stop:17890 length:1788 start_codon:yes stop_codon:yes gene_type:complete
MRNIKPLTSVIKQRNLQVSRLEEQSLRLRKKLVKTRGEAFEKIQGQLGNTSSSSGGGIGQGLLGLGGAALGGRMLRGLRNRFRTPPRTKPANKIVPTRGLRGGAKPRIPSIRGGLRMGRFNAIATTALTGVDYGLRRAEGQTQTQAVSGALSTTAGGLAGFAAGAKGGALLGGSIGALFGGVGAAPGAAIGGLLGGLLGSFGGANLGAAISDKVTGADQRRKVEEKKSRLSARTSKFGRTVEEFDNALDRFDLLTKKKIYFIDDEYNIDVDVDGDDGPLDPRIPRPRGPRPGGPKPVKLEKPDNIFEAEIPGVSEEHKDGRKFRYSRDYVPTGLDYSEIPSTPSNKVVPVDNLPILVRPFTEKFDLEEGKGERQQIDTPYGVLVRKPATLFAPAGFQFLNRDATEDKRFRTEQTIKSAPVQAVGGATGFLSFLSVFRGLRGRRSTTRTRSNTEILGKDAKPTQPPTTAPPRSVKRRTRVRQTNVNPITKRRQTVREQLEESKTGEVTVSNLRMSQEQLENLFRSPSASATGGTNFNAMILPLLAGAAALGTQQGQGSQQMPFMVSPPESESVITPETSMPYSKYLEYESYMKVWK